MTTHPLSGAALKLDCLTKSYSFMTFGKTSFWALTSNDGLQLGVQSWHTNQGFSQKDAGEHWLGQLQRKWVHCSFCSFSGTWQPLTAPQNMKRPVDHGETPKTQPGETLPGCASMVPLHKLNCLTKLRGFPNENRISAVIQSTEVTFCGLKWLPLLLPYWMYITVVFNFWFSSGLIQICFVSFIGAAPDKHHGSPCQNYQTNSAKSLHVGSLHCFRGVCLKMRGPIFQRNAVIFFLENPSPG